MYTSGVSALIDLPRLSVLVRGPDDLPGVNIRPVPLTWDDRRGTARAA
jgi:hypothetical protein